MPEKVEHIRIYRTDYTNGMRATFFSDDSRNPSGEHVAGLGDRLREYQPVLVLLWWGISLMGGWTLKYVDRVYVYSNDPVPPPVADFSANTKTGNIINGNFETGCVNSVDRQSGRQLAPLSNKKDLTVFGSLHQH